MKMYRDEHSLRMVGKSWQIRAKLQELSKSTLTLQQYLQLGKEQNETIPRLYLIK